MTSSIMRASISSLGNACDVTATISRTIWHCAGPAIWTNRSPKLWSAGGGCDFPAKPRLTAGEQPVLWSESADTAVLRLVADVRLQSAAGLETRALFSAETLLTTGELHLLLRDIVPNLHLIADAQVQSGDRLAVLIPLDRDGLDRLAALDRLLRHLAGYRVPADPRVTAQQRRRLKAMLRAMDARQHRASQREIAEALFGPDRVDREHWPTSPLRDAVRDLLKDGAEMIAGGYRKLLRFRRRK